MKSLKQPSMRPQEELSVSTLQSFHCINVAMAGSKKGFRSSCLEISIAQPDQLGVDTDHRMSTWVQFLRSIPELSVTHTVAELEPAV